MIPGVVRALAVVIVSGLVILTYGPESTRDGEQVSDSLFAAENSGVVAELQQRQSAPDAVQRKLGGPTPSQNSCSVLIIKLQIIQSD